MSQYGVNVANAFALLDDEVNDVIPSTVPAAATAAAAPIADKKRASAPDRNAPGGKGPYGNPSRNNNNKNETAITNDNRSRSAADGAPRGGRPPKHVHDRRSGTGRDSEVKRQGKGAYNWGTTEPTAVEGADVAAAAGKASDDRVEKADEVVPAAEPAAPVEPEIEQLDLNEYLKSQEALRVDDDDKLDIRRVAEDANEQVLSRSDDTDDDQSGLLSTPLLGKKKKAKKASKKTVLSLEEFAKPASRGEQAPRRGGGGSFRNERSGPAVRRSPVSGIKLDDQAAFPSLAVV